VTAGDGRRVEIAVLAEASTATTVAERLSATAEVEADATPEPEPGPERAAEHAAEMDCLAIGTELSDASGAECLLSVREEAPDLPVVLFGPDIDANRGGTAGRTEYVTGDDPETVTERIAGVIDAWRDSDVVDLGETSVATVEGLLDGGAEGSDAFDRVPEPAVEYEHDDTPRVGAVNAAFESAFGVRAETVVGEPLDEVVFSVGSGDHAELLDGTAVEAELRCRTVEGVRTFLLRTTPPTDDDPGVALYTDISDYKSVEERYSALVQSSSDALFILDRQGIVDYVSPAVEEAFGYDPGALVGYPLTEYVHPEDRETVGELLSDPTGWAGETRSVTYRFRAENEWRTVESAARSRLYDPAVEGVVMNCRDVTERERYQRELERQNDRLEEFASVVSHDLRNPLNVAHGHLQNARLGLDDPDVDVDLATSLSEVATSMDRMEALIDELLTLARKGEDVEEPEPVGLASVWEDAVSTVDTDGVDTTVESDAGMLADRSRLRRAFENLLRNVVDHVDGETTVRVGVVTVEADATGQIGDGTAVETAPTGIYVEDDGPGIPEPEREQIFEPRYTTRDEGTGFGLNIVRQIVEAHGWSVEVVDGSDGGARFEVTGVEFVDDGHLGG
jgi:PAS domain S-box-containing protein